jgi:hypothetical protein
MKTAMEVFKLATARGLRFHMIAPDTVGINGPADVIQEMDADLDAFSLDLIAIVQEFAVDSFPVWLAQGVLREGSGALNARQSGKSGRSESNMLYWK